MPKPAGAESRKDNAVTVKARRMPVRLARVNAAPSLKILGSATHV